MGGKRIRAVFMGSDAIALPFLRDSRETHADAVEWVGVFTQPDRRSGRGMRLHMNAVKEWALEADLPVRQPGRCGADDEAWLAEQAVDLVVVMAYGQLLKRSLLDLPPLGAVNFHASPLPRLRGASPIATALAEGWSETAVTLMKMVLRMDAGPVADVERVPIAEEDTLADLRARVGQACVPLWRRAVERLRSGGHSFAEQDESEATYCRIIRKEDAWLDFNAPARVLACRIRAFQPWPGAVVPHDGHELKIGAATEVQGDFGESAPGTVRFDEAGLPVVVCGRRALRLDRFQRPGGRMLPATEFLRGYPLQDGTVLASREMAPLVGSKPFRR
ncbi:MAG: methionyl-tRNA formyltransferase [Opitutales bacterium]|nr:methionyl-tRNA formyltransferase [Opitutales bacterium]